MGQTTTPTDLKKTIAKLEARSRQKQALFMTGVAMAILGFVGFLASLALVATSPNAIWMLVSLLTLLGIIVGVVLLFFCGSARSVAKRSLGLAKAAQTIQGDFVERPDAGPFELFKSLRCFAACNKHGKPTNLVHSKAAAKCAPWTMSALSEI